MEIKSSAFLEGTRIPQRYTCEGENVSPPLSFHDVPQDARSLVLVVSDPDAPSGDFTHWLVWNLPPTLTEINEGEVPESATEGQNDFGLTSWGGPCPPHGMHRYVFTLYALDTLLELPQMSNKTDLLSHMSGLVLTEASLTGLYTKLRV